MRRSTASIVLAGLAGFAMAACGGGGDDKSQAEQTVRDFVKATDTRDADKVCDELVTTEFIEQATQQTGEKAGDACKQQIKSLQRGSVKLVKVDRTTIDGEKARVRVTLEVQKQRQPQVFNLRKQDGDWRLAAGGAG